MRNKLFLVSVSHGYTRRNSSLINSTTNGRFIVYGWRRQRNGLFQTHGFGLFIILMLFGLTLCAVDGVVALYLHCIPIILLTFSFWNRRIGEANEIAGKRRRWWWWCRRRHHHRRRRRRRQRQIRRPRRMRAKVIDWPTDLLIENLVTVPH